MKKLFLCVVLTQAVVLAVGQTILPSETQIKLALLAAPADKAAEATVYGYNTSGDLVILRRGSNEMICLADDPKQKGFSVACYHQDLEAFMKRGRQLKKEGKPSKEISDTREREVAAGKLNMSEKPSALFVYSAKEEDYDPINGTVNEGYLRYVIYIPFATAESTGLPLKPDVPGMPWLMDPGTHKAHIMISPPRD